MTVQLPLKGPISVLRLSMPLLPRGPISSVTEPVFQFDEFELHCGRFQLLRKGRALRVEPKPLELLILLVSRKGHLVSRREIVEKLWDSNIFVDTDHSINTAIRKLRYLLRDDSETPKYIETVTGMGYRFVAPVLDKAETDRGAVETKAKAHSEAEQAVATPQEVRTSPLQAVSEYPGLRPVAPAIKSRLRSHIGIAVAILLVATGSSAWYFARPDVSLRVLSYTPVTHEGG